MASTSKQIITGLSAALAMTALSYIPAQASTTATPKDVVLTVGAKASERNLTWLGGLQTEDYVQIVRADHHHGYGRDQINGWRGARIVRPAASGVAGEQSGWEWNQAKLTGLDDNASYRYRICSAQTCSITYQFDTTSDGSFNFLVYGDPQVYLGTKTGQNGVVENPSAGWAATLAESTKRFDNTAFLMTAGDQVDSYAVNKQVGEWDAFLAPEQVTQYALAPNLGNHDNASGAGYLYAQHFALPNLSSQGATAAGTGDYWYTYNGVLFASLNSNSLDFTAHETFLKQAIAANPRAKWKVVSFHHSPFSAADHPLDADVTAIRTTLAPVLSKLGINLVIGGHDHDYARSYLMNGSTPASTQAGTLQIAKRGQVLYLATNSASGGKFYDLTGPYAWTAVTDQSLKANYTNVEVRNHKLIATTYEMGGRVIDRVLLTSGK
jgi:hypothetical protein